MATDSRYCNCLFFSANAVARLLTSMAEEEFAVTGLSPSHAFVLMTVCHKPGLQAGEISREMQLTPSTVTRLVEKLEQRKLLERESVGRSTRVTPTAAATELLPDVKAAWRRLYARYTTLLGPEAAAQLTAATYEATKKLEPKG
ncbi:MarR family winged helix-turn-helix transcriptional regulator [Hymenobacter jejuensis]|uniref:MarR family transcriptional regulator n=1 Tax=Hymenobacter jejuensis TaxID=2502781 RepID=A0A5B8A377_9BACT|nr:MarR family transcriptional regulator [Hymenobacter jejuensis]QDA61053.1 MarR family transcriptional regulator [Hymenobacter jejuensis]